MQTVRYNPQTDPQQYLNLALQQFGQARDLRGDVRNLSQYAQFQQQLRQAQTLQQALMRLAPEQRQQYQGPSPQWPAHQQFPQFRTPAFQQGAAELQLKQMDPAYQAQLKAAEARKAYYERPTALSPTQKIAQRRLDKIDRYRAKEAAGTITKAEQMTLDRMLDAEPPTPLSPTQKIAQKKLDKITRLQAKAEAGTITRAEQMTLDRMLDAEPPKQGEPLIKSYYDKKTKQMMLMQWNPETQKWDKTGIAAEEPEEEKVPTMSELKVREALKYSEGDPRRDRLLGVALKDKTREEKIDFWRKQLASAQGQYFGIEGGNVEPKMPELAAVAERELNKLLTEQPQGQAGQSITQTATDPKTGKKVGWNGTEWIPLN